MSKGAPVGNQFWKLRSRHGRNKLFATPELLWEAACEYFQWCDDNPIIEIDYKGKDAERVEIPRLRAYTIQGLCLYLDASPMYFTEFEMSLKGKDDQLSKDFFIIVSRIRSCIYDQKFSGAAANQLNHNIIARDLGLQDASKINHSISNKPVFLTDPLADDIQTHNGTSKDSQASEQD